MGYAASSMTGPRCARCGKDHEELEPAFRLPDAVFAVAREERPERVRESDDFVSVDDRAFFIRCVAPVPVEGREHPFCWGFWVKVSRAGFEEHRRFFAVDPPLDHPGLAGTIANQTRLLPPTLGQPVHVHLGRGKVRPSVMLLDDGHPLASQQQRGVTEAQARAWSEAACRNAGVLPDQDPRSRPFTPSLEVEGWCLVDPGEVGREVLRLEAAPGPGETVKVPFRFLAADPVGDVCTRVEFMWVLLDEVRDDGWWSGTLANDPFVPGPIDVGSRVWLRPEHVIAIEARDGPARRGAPPAARWVDRVLGWLRRP